MGTRYHGTSVISWSQTEVDGIPAAPVSVLTVGAVWRWTGRATRVDGAGDALLLQGATGAEQMRGRAARKVRRMIGLAKPRQPLAIGGAVASGSSHPGHDRGHCCGHDEEPETDPGIVLTDGLRTYAAMVLPVPDSATRLLAFVGEMPPADSDLWIVRLAIAQDAGSGDTDAADSTSAGGVICFTPSTRIATPTGPRHVGTLVPGDLILTRDNGPQPVIWTGSRRMSGARLFAMPELRPVRLRAGALETGVPDGDLLVSPRHRMLLRGPAAQALFNTPEVLVCAGDLVDDRAVIVERNLREVTYIHILLERHNIVWANGVETESFHPSNTDLGCVAPDQTAALLRALPGLAYNRLAYGDFARRNLSSPEAAILRHGTTSTGRLSRSVLAPHFVG